MTLQQLRYLCEVVRCRLNISRAARALGASQPAVSQQIRMLEESLGVAVFLRSRNQLTGLTGKGETIVTAAQAVLAEATNLESIAARSLDTGLAQLRIASTHPQATYGLPKAIRKFKVSCPGVDVHISHQTDEKLWQLVQNGHVDLAITTDTQAVPKDLLVLMCYPMKRSLVARKGHALLRKRRLTLHDIAEYPLIGLDERSNGRRRLMRAFNASGVRPRFVVTAADEVVAKACVEEGLGVAIVPSIVHDPKRDAGLGAVDVTPLLEPSVTSIVVRRNVSGMNHIELFIQAFAPAWTRDEVRRAARE